MRQKTGILFYRRGAENLFADARLSIVERLRVKREITETEIPVYLSQFAPYIPYLGAVLSPGVYDIPVCHIRVRGVYTNTIPVDAYRGAGRPEAAYVIERLVDHAAREVGTAPDRLRRRNFIKPDSMPYQTATGQNYDSGNFAAHLARAQELADWSGFSRRLFVGRLNRFLYQGVELFARNRAHLFARLFAGQFEFSNVFHGDSLPEILQI